MQQYNFPEVKRGDSFDGVLFTMILNGSPLNLTSILINMDLRTEPSSTTIIKHFEIGDGFTINADPTTGIFSFDKWDVDVDSFNYYYDIEFENTDTSEIKTYISGRWHILQDVTRPH